MDVLTDRPPLPNFIVETPAASLFPNWPPPQPHAFPLDPRAFTLDVDGTCLEPEINDGDMVLCDPDAVPKDGDYVVVVITWPDGGRSLGIKRLERRGTGWGLVTNDGREIWLDHEIRLVGKVTRRYRGCAD